MSNEYTSYKDAGVDIDRGDQFISRIKSKVAKTYNSKVMAGVGGFASLYEISNDRYLACGVDGVGTKLKIAQELGIHSTIGQDLVAMCANDILCTGASPMFFMDYLATGKLELETAESLIDGICNACIDNELALVGGETAEMPGMYENGEYDLAGFACGEVSKDNLIDGSKVKEGDSIIGFQSSGFHSNGYSLLRKLIGDDEKVLQEALTPTKLYWPILKDILQDPNKRKLINGMAHITGGGVHNIARINKKFDYHISNLPNYNEIAPIFKKVLESSNISKNELFKTFNMGVGFIVITSQPNELKDELNTVVDTKNTFFIGEVTKGRGKVVF